MRKIILMLCLMSFLTANSKDLDYKHYNSEIKSEIAAQKTNIKNIKKELKVDKNNVELHKKLVYASTKLSELESKRESVQHAIKMYDKLVKENKKLDEQKIKLLKIKKESMDADSIMIRLFK